MWDSIRDWVLRELSEVRRAPAAFVITLALGGVISVYVTRAFFSERFAIMEARLQQAQETLKRQGEGTSNSAGDALVTWGAGLPQACGATLARAPLARYGDKFDVAVACGIRFPNIDRFADTAISLSDKFILTETSSLSLTIRVSPEMTSALRKWIETEQLKVSPERRANMRVNLFVWYEVLLVPKDVLISDIKRLSDVRRLGGQVLSSESRAVGVQGLALASFSSNLR